MSASNRDKLTYVTRYQGSILGKIKRLEKEAAAAAAQPPQPLNIRELFNDNPTTLDNNNSLFVLKYINETLNKYKIILEDPRNKIIIDDMLNKLPELDTENNKFIQEFLNEKFLLKLHLDYDWQSDIYGAICVSLLFATVIGIVALLSLVVMPEVAMAFACLGIGIVGGVGIGCSLLWHNQISSKASVLNAIIKNDFDELKTSQILNNLAQKLEDESAEDFKNTHLRLDTNIRSSFFNTRLQSSNKTLHQEVYDGAQLAVIV